MKKVTLPFLFAFCISFVGMSQMKHTVVTRGFTFSPDSLTIMPMDTVIFTIGSQHDLTEVDSSTWALNGTTPVPSGLFVGGGETDTVIFDTTGVFYYVCTPHVSGGMKGKIVISEGVVTSLPFIAAGDNGINIYPNPTQSNVTVQIPQMMQVQSISLINAQGAEVLNQNVSVAASSHNLQVGNLEKGIYQVFINTSDKRYTSKIVVQ